MCTESADLIELSYHVHYKHSSFFLHSLGDTYGGTKKAYELCMRCTIHYIIIFLIKSISVSDDLLPMEALSIDLSKPDL